MATVAPTSSTPALAPPRVPRWGAMVLAVIIVVVAALIFLVIYVTVQGPSSTHFNALITIGVLSLIFGLASYVAQAASPRPAAQRALGWGFLALGFTLLFVTEGVGPNPTINAIDRLIALIVLGVLLAITVALIYWRFRAVATDKMLKEGRQAWQSRPAPSAFNYSTGTPPNVSPPPTPASVPPTPPQQGH
ncbi:MAG: hypothetical protein WCA77_00650 [Thermoplasmata archaeon]